ncbi:Putative NAD-binding protein (D-isomer specific 2-hydroxyacid dehydrogenase?) [Mycobacteroides abscessus subsp. abscessus]|uniref:NAD-binding protein (D-isomer specific 2-hydroxyacid dehydrogenase?) n=4 Tax=Mycobacteroides abscessus TaxID=36809 RepID=B1MJX7_MYCA9|nr:D-2-hydroxyacid dehydrogenase [Mycobacteroides abscessus]ETZ86639.1 D-isomer specific 2-hydroxyacid dehydrogenase, catalytic domain protein [Mycobacteroides abscessus MAB_030201_1075]ETZ92934.1 D-isomer specific 2-hydroxyacid dehydrogenase, catalytic domain protein [Mycobacteroides abscessus MAB_030201_1061]ALM18587.1 hydroxyacid dehydrogenase [Mycobacteroides abscessus]AMU47634.1 hydroxyacid dehydrogenase [Mycobacteroides abscessus]AMU52675.1 hydroxyacid dehydrogenase [Mycobacteroides absc
MNEQLVRRPVIAVQHSPDSVPERLAPVTAAAEVRLVESDRLATALPGAEVLFVYDFRSSALRETWSAADSLRWVQIASTGVDPVLFDEFVASDVVLTNSRGIFERPIAEYVLAQILAFAKDIRRSTRAQAALSWRHFESESIEGTPVGVLGTGPIGQAISTLLGAVGMRVTVLGRAESADLSSHVGEFEYLVLAAPLTPQTRGIVNARVLSAMRPTARLINVGRGELVGTWDLVSALNRGGIAGAALDVTDPEPLPVGHPLWRTPNTHITPHNSGDVRGWSDRLQDQFVVNFERYLRGEELLNIVDKNRMHRHA